jgi:hypothetical protein
MVVITQVRFLVGTNYGVRGFSKPGEGLFFLMKTVGRSYLVFRSSKAEYLLICELDRALSYPAGGSRRFVPVCVRLGIPLRRVVLQRLGGFGAV